MVDIASELRNAKLANIASQEAAKRKQFVEDRDYNFYITKFKADQANESARIGIARSNASSSGSSGSEFNDKVADQVYSDMDKYINDNFIVKTQNAKPTIEKTRIAKVLSSMIFGSAEQQAAAKRLESRYGLSQADYNNAAKLPN
jgi:hypothetical protein